MAKPICYVMVGLPGLGKTTHIDGMYKLDAFVYSTDRFIEDAARHFGITYDEAFEHNIKAATDSMNAMLDVAIKERSDIVWDQSNLSVSTRSLIINRMKQAGYQIRCACIVPPTSDYTGDKQDWVARLDSRSGKMISQSVLAEMIDSFELPTASEGFDMITFYDMYGGLLAIDLCDHA